MAGMHKPLRPGPIRKVCNFDSKLAHDNIFQINGAVVISQIG